MCPHFSHRRALERGGLQGKISRFTWPDNLLGISFFPS